MSKALEFFRRHVPGNTYGDLFRGVLAIKDEEEARLFCEGYVECLRDLGGMKEHTPVEVAKVNIGFCFGEGMAPEAVQMWVRACGASHPWFGTSIPTPEEALEQGRLLGEKMRGKD